MTATSVHVKGLDEMLRNLNKAISGIIGDVQKGLTLGALKIKGESMEKTPVDTGNLRASHYLVSGDGTRSEHKQDFKPTDSKGKPSKSAAQVASEHSGHVSEAASNAKAKAKPFVEIGCTAFYAEKVHEDLNAKHIKTNKKGDAVRIGQAKFLETAIKENADKLVGWVKRFAKR